MCKYTLWGLIYNFPNYNFKVSTGFLCLKNTNYISTLPMFEEYLSTVSPTIISK